MNASNFEPLFAKAEAAIDAHPTLRRAFRSGVEVTYPRFHVSRLGFTFEMTVHLEGSRKKPSDIVGQGDTPEEAVDHMISGLDHWASALK